MLMNSNFDAYVFGNALAPESRAELRRSAVVGNKGALRVLTAQNQLDAGRSKHKGFSGYGSFGDPLNDLAQQCMAGKPVWEMAGCTQWAVEELQRRKSAGDQSAAAEIERLRTNVTPAHAYTGQGEWESWCDNNFPNDPQNSDCRGSLGNCTGGKTGPCNWGASSPPWTMLGRTVRGLPQSAEGVMSAVKETAAKAPAAMAVVTPAATRATPAAQPATPGAQPGGPGAAGGGVSVAKAGAGVGLVALIAGAAYLLLK